MFWGKHPFSYTGRLNSLYPHCYGTNFDSKFMVDFEELYWISAIALQGFNKDGVTGRVAKFVMKTRFEFDESGVTTYDDQFTVSMRLCLQYDATASTAKKFFRFITIVFTLDGLVYYSTVPLHLARVTQEVSPLCLSSPKKFSAVFHLKEFP